MVEVLFHDQRGRQRVPHLSDYFGFTMAALGDKARPCPLSGWLDVELQELSRLLCRLFFKCNCQRAHHHHVPYDAARVPHPAHACMLPGQKLAVSPPQTEHTE